ncbi:hypothetical protein I317_01753 [Kwoniella heveanensis CBS 569]|nr:hypothetical protein I317_01753 [Kwoniella heveanensis CBS 569]
MGGMNPGIGMGMGGMGMGMGMDPRMQQMQQMQGMGGVGVGGMGNYGQAWRQLGYDYTLPSLGYKPEATWGAWDLANAQYNGGRLERSFFDNIVRLLREYQALKSRTRSGRTWNNEYSSQEPPLSPLLAMTPSTDSPNFLSKQISSLTNFFANRHLSEEAARDAHRRVYYQAEGADAGNKTLGGAAAYQAYLIWDRDHYSAYHANPTQENRERLVGLAVAELFSLWDRVQPRSSRASTEEAAQYAAATAKYLFDRHYDLPHNHHHRRNGGSRYSGYGADNDSDSDDDRRMRRRSMYGQQPYGMGMQNPMMGGGMPMQNGMMGGQGMMPPGGMGIGMGGGMGMGGMPGMGMAQPGMGAMGMPGSMGMGNGMMNPMMGGMGMHNGMGMGMAGMGGMGMMNPMNMVPGNHGQMGEAVAAPGMHPYTYGAQSGVAYGSQPIDQNGNPTFPGGPGMPGRSWYGYGQQRYF